MMECVFCKIITGQLPTNKVYESEFVLVFSPLKEHVIAKGHLLVIPKKHCVNIYDIPKTNLHKLMDTIKFVSLKLKEKYNAEGINILHASGKVAQQSCFHFHLHLIPRYKDDGLDTWPNTKYKEEHFPRVYKDIAKLF